MESEQTLIFFALAVGLRWGAKEKEARKSKMQSW